MNILNDILEKEGDNRGSVYLYCLEDSWKAFGYSAFYLSLLYPGIKIVKYDNPDIICFCMCISDDCLMEIFEMSQSRLARVDSLWQRKKCRDCALVDMVDGRKQF